MSTAPIFPTPPRAFAPGTLFARVFRESPVAMAVTTPGDERYVDVNDAYAALVGCDRAALLGRPNQQLPPPEPGAGERTCALVTAQGDIRTVIASAQTEVWNGKAYHITLVQDLTAIRRAEDALRSSEARLRLFFENLPLPVLVYDAETVRILDVNAAAVELYGYSRDELLAMSMLDIRPPDARLKFLETLHSLPDDTRSVGVWQHRHKDGRVIDVDVTSFGLELDGRRARLTVLQDVTEQLAMQAALRGSEERLRIIAEMTNDVIWDMDIPSGAVHYTSGLTTLFGHEPGETTSSLDWWLDHIHPEDRPGSERSFYDALAAADAYWSGQYRFRRADGQYAHVLDRGYFLRDPAGRATRVIGAMVDITRQVEMKEAATRAALEERRRLARDLHDAVTQSLYSLSLMVEAARRHARLGDRKATNDYIARLGELAQQSLKEMRLLVYEMRPSALDEQGLAGALQARLDAVERHSGIRARLNVELSRKLPPDVQLQLYRVAGEALNNALKHAAASAVRVSIRAYGDGVVMEIEDNGRGFDPEAAATAGGLGLVSMRERVEQLGGRFELETAPGRGTTIRVELDTMDGNHG